MSEISPKPAATTEKPELYPGGPDALERDPDGEGLARDLPPDLNPATGEVPVAITEPDDKDQAPTGEADQEAGTTEETPAAGQVDEEGNAEPPA